MPNTVNWEALSKRLHEAYPEVKTILDDWLAKNPDWLCESLFTSNFPPKIHVNLQRHGTNTLSDAHKEKVGEFATQVCTKFPMKCKLYHPYKSGLMSYTFYFPVPKE